jgi:putative membrane protein
MEFGYIKALHLIFVVTWFAGLFYIVRLFIYFVEAGNEEANAKAILQQQYKLMSKRLWYGITWPSAILTAFFATWLFSTNFSYYISQPWMHVKLTFVLALYVYHLMCHKMFVQLINDQLTFSSFKLRIFNEIATVFLVAIVFLVVLKNEISWIWGVVGILMFGVLLMLAIKAYKKIRDKNKSQQ